MSVGEAGRATGARLRGRALRVLGVLGLVLLGGFVIAPSYSANVWPLRRHRPRAPVVVPAALRSQAFAIEQSSEGHAVVDLERPGADPAAPAPETLLLLDGHGVRVATRAAVRKLCATACGTENSAQSCHVVGDYDFQGRSLEQFALAFDGATAITPHPLDRQPVPRAAQLERLAHVFRKVYRVPENVYGARWMRTGSGPKLEWIEESTRWVMAPNGHPKPVVAPTGAHFSSCSLAAFGPVTEIRCPMRHTLYVDNRFIGMNDDFELGPLVRYSADIDGTLVYVVLIKKKNETRPLILFRPRDGVDSKDPADGWYKVDASMAHGAC